VKHHHKTSWEKCQYCLRVNAVAKENPQYFLRLPSDDHRYSYGEILFFPLNIGMSHLIRSMERNGVLCFSNELVSMAVAALTHVSQADLIGSWHAEA
jgi:hypothetical protein